MRGCSLRLTPASSPVAATTTPASRGAGAAPLCRFCISESRFCADHPQGPLVTEALFVLL